MLTNNYYTMLSSYYQGDNLKGVDTAGGSGNNVNRDMNRTSPRVDEGTPPSMYNNDMYAGNFMLLGTGTTPPTIDDYKLASFVKLTVVNSDQTYYSRKGSILTYTRTFRNDLSEAVTITELGMYIGGPNTNKPYLIAREVLAEPVVIQSGESKAFTFTLK